MLERDRNKARRGLKGMEVPVRSTVCINGRQGVRELQQGELWAENGELRGEILGRKECQIEVRSIGQLLSLWTIPASMVTHLAVKTQLPVICGT